jgi:hypothetical protein
MSPLKSFRSRRKFHISDNQSPKTVKHERSLFSLFNTARTQTPDSPEVFKVGTAVKMPKTVAPSKNNLRDSRSRYAVNSPSATLIFLDDYVPAQPKRSKSLGDILGTITTRVSSKYNTVTRRSQGQAGINHSSVPDSGIGCVTGNAERVTASTRQKWRIQHIESEMSAFWRLEQVMDSKYKTPGFITITERCKAPRTMKLRTLWDLKETVGLQIVVVRMPLRNPYPFSS